MGGYVRRRGRGSWEVTVDLGRDPATGRRRRRFLSTRGTKRDAERALAEALHQRDTGIDISPGKITVGDYLRRWLRDYAEGAVAASTLARYTGIVEQHLIPALGWLKLAELRPAHIQAAYATFTRRDRRGVKLSAKTVFEHHAVLREALNWAVRWQLLARNPVDAASPPRPERPEMRVLSVEEAQRLLEAAAATRHYTLLYLALATGARLGELLALRWQEVDLEQGMMQITRTARFFSGRGIVFSHPKTHRSRRPIAPSSETVRVLSGHRHRQLEERLRVGPAYRDDGLVLADPRGRPIFDSTVRRAFYSLTRRAGIGHVRIHDLRHTAATLMLRVGVNPKVVSERLGHATVSITLDTYSHVLPDLQREAAAALDEILVGNWSAKV